jgi:hypothetical protein
MTEPATTYLSPWLNFFVMTGSSAAALTGLMFVVITLVMGSERVRRSPDGVSTFSTPTVMHFAAALLVSAVLAAPWRLLIHPGILLGIFGLYGLLYILRVMFRAARLTAYTPDLEDWVWYSILPFAAYGAIFAGAIALFSIPVSALFAIAAGVVLLVFIGIRNSWDVVTYLAVGGGLEPPE